MQSLRNQIPRAARTFSTSAARPLSKMTLIGRLGTQPETASTSTGRDLIRYALAVNHGRADENGNRPTSWFRITSFQNDGPQKDLILSLEKGTLVYVEAEARMDTYEAGNGEKRTSLNLIQRSIQTLSRPQSIESESTEASITEAGATAS